LFCHPCLEACGEPKRPSRIMTTPAEDTEEWHAFFSEKDGKKFFFSPVHNVASWMGPETPRKLSSWLDSEDAPPSPFDRIPRKTMEDDSQDPEDSPIPASPKALVFSEPKDTLTAWKEPVIDFGSRTLQSAQEKYQETCKVAQEKYQATRKVAQEKYQESRKVAQEKYQESRQTAQVKYQEMREVDWTSVAKKELQDKKALCDRCMEKDPKPWTAVCVLALAILFTVTLSSRDGTVVRSGRLVVPRARMFSEQEGSQMLGRIQSSMKEVLGEEDIPDLSQSRGIMAASSQSSKMKITVGEEIINRVSSIKREVELPEEPTKIEQVVQDVSSKLEKVLQDARPKVTDFVKTVKSNSKDENMALLHENIHRLQQVADKGRRKASTWIQKVVEGLQIDDVVAA